MPTFHTFFIAQYCVHMISTESLRVTTLYKVYQSGGIKGMMIGEISRMSLPRNTNSSHLNSLRDWFKKERHILYLFGTYGLLMGVSTYFPVFHDPSSTGATLLMLTLPFWIIAVGILHTFTGSFGMESLSPSWLIIPGSVLGWAIVGFVPYMIIKFYRFTKRYPT